MNNIDILEEFLDNYSFIEKTAIGSNDIREFEIKISNIEIKAISTLIAENKELKEDNEYLKNQIPIDKIFYYSYKEFIPKSKVKDEISYLRQKYDLEEDYINYETVIEILQELLED